MITHAVTAPDRPTLQGIGAVTLLVRVMAGMEYPQRQLMGL
jgi:hypothetical protein